MATTSPLRGLIDSAGGQTAFARKVWPKDDPEKHKGKVHKWYKQMASPNAAAAREIAAAFFTSTDEVIGVPLSPRARAEGIERIQRAIAERRQERIEKIVRRFDRDYARFLKSLEREGIIVSRP